jgi:hypothetical protein
MLNTVMQKHWRKTQLWGLYKTQGGSRGPIRLFSLSRWLPESTSLDVIAQTPAGQKVLLYHPAKTGGTSLRTALSLGGSTNHGTPADTTTLSDWESGVSVTTVRHPWARFISSFTFHTAESYTGKHKALFNEFRGQPLGAMDYLRIATRHRLLRPQVLYCFFPSAKKLRVNLVLKLEESKGWPARLSSEGIFLDQCSEVPHLNRSAPTATSIFDDPLLKLQIRRLYWMDFVFLDYR